MSSKIYLRGPWLYIITALCLVAGSVGPLFGYLNAAANSRAAEASTVMLDDGDGCDEQLFATLTGATIGGQMPRGFAKFKLDDDGDDHGHNRLKVFVRFVNLPENTMLNVFVDGAFAGQITLRANGNSHGFFDPNFDINEGDVVEVKNGGTVILSGTFHGCEDGTPTPTATPTATPTCATIVTLSGSQEVPPNNSLGAGVATVSLSADLTSLNVSVGFSGLSAPALAAHIHGPAVPGTNAGILYPLANVPNTTSGFIPAQSFAITPTQFAELQAGLFYVNLHTSTFPGGEIRAQLAVTAGCGATPTATPTNTPTATATPTPPQATLFTTRLRGGLVVPPVETNARGFAGVVLNADSTQIQAYAAFINLSSSQTSASINCPAIPGQNASVTFNLGTVGGTSGVLTGTFGATPLEVAELRAGVCYLLIGSQNNPGGEIRGQLINRFMHRDFDGDGKSDIALFRPSNGTWYFQNSSDGSFGGGPFGMAGDKPIAGDFDGDGRGEFAVFRNVNGSGVWYVQNSSDHSFVARHWGLGSDKPMSGDFDGDGRSDLAVFRPSDGNWYISRSSNGSLMAKHWGQNGDIPVSGDYDGDGINDIAIFRPSTGIWYINRSTNGSYSALQWGLQGDLPVTGDFDGDGLDDVAVFRASDGNWYVNGSRGAFLSSHFGTSGDIPVPGRFDGDDKTDLAVFRPSEGTWYILKSQTNSVTATNFGLSGDMPIINY